MKEQFYTGRLVVMVSPAMKKFLEDLSYRKRKSISELIREGVCKTYRFKEPEPEEREPLAYREGEKS